MLELIRHYASVFGRGNKYHYFIFSKGGFTPALQELGEQGEVTLLTLADIYYPPASSLTYSISGSSSK